MMRNSAKENELIVVTPAENVTYVHDELLRINVADNGALWVTWGNYQTVYAPGNWNRIYLHEKETA